MFLILTFNSQIRSVYLFYAIKYCSIDCFSELIWTYKFTITAILNSQKSEFTVKCKDLNFKNSFSL